MPNLTERQRNLLNLLNMLTQNLTETNLTDSNLDHNFAINLPGLGFSSNLNLGSASGNNGETPDEPESPDAPETVLDALRNLLNEQVELTTPFGTVSGTLINVSDDYVVIVEPNSDRVLVRIEKIELVRDL